jgi:hypothetical protein
MLEPHSNARPSAAATPPPTRTVANPRPTKSRAALARRAVAFVVVLALATWYLSDPGSGSGTRHGARAPTHAGAGAGAADRLAASTYGGGGGGGDHDHHNVQQMEHGASRRGGAAAGTGGNGGSGGGAGEEAEGDRTFGIKAVGIFHVFKKPPWGGGNQFLMALVKEFRRRKIKVVENAIADKVQLYMANAVTFKVGQVKHCPQQQRYRTPFDSRYEGLQHVTGCHVTQYTRV